MVCAHKSLHVLARWDGGDHGDPESHVLKTVAGRSPLSNCSPKSDNDPNEKRRPETVGMLVRLDSTTSACA